MIPDPLVELILEHRNDSATFNERTGEVWVSCTCLESSLWRLGDGWPTTPIPRAEADRLHTIHLATLIRQEGL